MTAKNHIKSQNNDFHTESRCQRSARSDQYSQWYQLLISISAITESTRDAQALKFKAIGQLHSIRHASCRRPLFRVSRVEINQMQATVYFTVAVL